MGGLGEGLADAIATRLSSPLALWERVRDERSSRGGEGSVSADRDPSSGADCVRATFSHNKGRREGQRSVRADYFFVSSIGTTFSGDA
jgi:hypothetical protein